MNNTIISLQKRLFAILMLITSIFIAIIIRLGFVQLVNGRWLQQMAADQWTRDLPLTALRGNITDRNGAKLATNQSTYNVYVRPSMVENANKVALILSNILGIDYEIAYQKTTNRLVSESLIKMQVGVEEGKQLIEKYEPGIMLSENSSRYYPYGDLLTQVLGFTTIDNMGQAGLEAFYNQYLTGVDGFSTTISDVHGVAINNTAKSYIPSIPGMNLELTIDVNIQQICEEALSVLVAEQKPKTASAIIMDVNTGEILAMASKPSFNLNSPDRTNIQELMQTVKNINIVDVYEPGSTFKVLTMAAALEEGKAKLTDTFYDPGYRIIDGEKIKCWKLTGHGHQDLTDGLCNSCNSVFLDLALRLGKDKMYEYFNKFGLGQSTGIDFFGESYGIIMDKDAARTVDVARMGFGQAIAVTPLQEITAIASTVNGGKLLEPYFVKSIKDATGKIIYNKQQNIKTQPISTKTSEIINNMMEETLVRGSGYYAFMPGYRVGGKTGTSQKYEDGRIVQKYTASFCGTFPADKPEYIVLVIADEPTAGSYFGSVAATPYAKLMFEGIVKYKNIEPVNLEEDLKKSEKNIAMPSLIGKSLSEAYTTLTLLGLYVEVAGEGGIVIGQFPPPGTMLSKHSVVVLET